MPNTRAGRSRGKDADTEGLSAVLGAWDPKTTRTAMKWMAERMNAVYEELDEMMLALGQTTDDVEDWVTADVHSEREKCNTEREAIMTRLSVDVPELIDRITKIRDKL